MLYFPIILANTKPKTLENHRVRLALLAFFVEIETTRDTSTLLTNNLSDGSLQPSAVIVWVNGCGRLVCAMLNALTACFCSGDAASHASLALSAAPFHSHTSRISIETILHYPPRKVNRPHGAKQKKQIRTS